MAEEHTARPDSGVPFETGNYLMTSTSKIEWAFVTAEDHGEALDTLGISEWPGCERNRKTGSRKAQRLSDFTSKWQAVDRRLQAAGEQALSTPEFVALRLYTGPMFMK